MAATGHVPVAYFPRACDQQFAAIVEKIDIEPVPKVDSINATVGGVNPNPGGEVVVSLYRRDIGAREIDRDGDTLRADEILGHEASHVDRRPYLVRGRRASARLLKRHATGRIGHEDRHGQQCEQEGDIHQSVGPDQTTGEAGGRGP